MAIIPGVVGRLMPPAPKDVRVLIPGTCEHVILHGKGGFAESIKVMDYKMGNYPGLPRLGGPNLITWALKHGRGRQKNQRNTWQKKRQET